MSNTASAEEIAPLVLELARALRARRVHPSGHPVVADALRRENLDIPAGKLDQGLRESLVRVAGRAAEPRDFNGRIVTERSGFPITLCILGKV